MSRLNSPLTVYTIPLYFRQIQYNKHADDILFTEKAKQRCVMGVGMCLYAQLVQTTNKQCKSAIVLQCYVSVVSADIITARCICISAVFAVTRCPSVCLSCSGVVCQNE